MVHQTKREDLPGEHPFGDAGQLILFTIFILGIILDKYVFGLSKAILPSIHIIYRILLSSPFFILAYVLVKDSHRRVFKEYGSQLKVLRTGTYKYIRHPMYLGALLIYVAVIIVSLSFLSFIIWLVILGFYIYIAKYEEAVITRKLRKEYRRYKKKTGMLFPKIFK